MSDTEMLSALYNGMQEMKTDIQEMKSGMQEMKMDIQELKTDVQNLKTDMQEVKADVQNLKTDVQNLKTDMQEVKTDVQNLKTDMQEVKADIGELKRRTTSMELTLENDIDTNIKRIAEGHLDLSRNLHEAMRVETEKEMLVVRVNILENDVRKLKEQMNQSA